MIKTLAHRIGGIATLFALLISSVAWPVQASGVRSAQATFPSGFVAETIITGLNYPTAISFASGNRIFIAEKEGKVKLWQNGTLLATPFVDITDEVNSSGDRGLLGMAVHPNFPDQPYVYLLYTYDPPGALRYGGGSRVSRLMRVTADPNNPNIASTAPEARTILVGKNSTLANINDANSDTGLPACQSLDTGEYVQDCIPADTKSHNVGNIAFGPDGMLYLSHGDGAHWLYTDLRTFRAQDLDTLAGKVMRVDSLTGQGLPDNPFYNGDPDSNRSKVFALGFRNPFRFALHPVTGELYTSDVGWETWEELNVGRGKNFGWPCYEGGSGNNTGQPTFQNDPTSQPRCQQINQSGSVSPAQYAYYHKVAPGGGALIAGAFYSGTVYPADYRGKLFLVDYTRVWMKYTDVVTQSTLTLQNFGTDISDGNSGPVQILSGPDTNIYYLNLGASPGLGEVRRVRYTAAGNNPPTARIDLSAHTGPLPFTVQFSGIDSFDPDAQALTYEWSFGDGITSTLPSPTHTYSNAGSYAVQLHVSDPLGASNLAQTTVNAGNNAPVITITLPTTATQLRVGDTMTYAASASDVEDGDLSAQIQWEGRLHHAQHIHPNYVIASGPLNTYTYADHGDDIWLELCAQVKDSLNAESTRPCVSLNPQTSVYTFTSAPVGLSLQYDGQSFTTPFSMTSVVGGQRLLIAPSTQLSLTFEAWSNSGPRSQTLIIAPTEQTITATYQGQTWVYLPVMGK